MGTGARSLSALIREPRNFHLVEKGSGMPVVAVVGGQWGDEGKGKVIDHLAGDADVVIRAHGGDNAGHTVINTMGEFALHLVPAGIFNPDAICVIAPGVALNPASLIKELDILEERGVDTRRLLVSNHAHMVMPYHLLLDRVEELYRGGNAIGTTGRGIGPTYGDKVDRIGLRVGDLLDPQEFRARLNYAVELKNLWLRAQGRPERVSADQIKAESHLRRAPSSLHRGRGPGHRGRSRSRCDGAPRRRAGHASRPRPRNLSLRDDVIVHRRRPLPGRRHPTARD
jgi:hypothetical protein